MINRGTQFSVANLKITISQDGSVDAAEPTVSLSLDLTSYWLEIAIAEFMNANKHHDELLVAEAADDNEQRSAAMEAECKACMQAFAAAAIALDAFYAAVKDRCSISPELVATWHEKGTARYKQLAEVFRRAFKLGPRSTERLRSDICEIFKWRDRTVHPASTRTQPVLYEELSVGTEWRFVAFRAVNARLVVGAALSIIAQLLARPRENHPELVKFCGPALKNLQPSVVAWETRFGELYNRDTARDIQR
jgi:hypothetical protein